MVMVMLALAIGGDTISNQARREAIIDGLFDLPSEFLLPKYITGIGYILGLFGYMSFEYNFQLILRF